MGRAKKGWREKLGEVYEKEEVIALAGYPLVLVSLLGYLLTSQEGVLFFGVVCSLVLLGFEGYLTHQMHKKRDRGVDGSNT